MCLGIVLGGVFLTTKDNSITADDLDRNQLGPRSFLMLVAVTILLSALIRIYNLQASKFLVDEFWHFNSAVGYVKTGEFRFWDFISAETGELYTRSWIFTWMVAQSMSFFGLELTQARLVPLIWGLMIFLPFYGIASSLNCTRLETVIAMVLLGISPYFITISRWVRHYSFFTFLYLLALWLVWVIYERRSRNILWVPVGLLVLLFCFHVHYLPTLVLVVCLGMLLGLKQIKKKLVVNGRSFNYRDIIIFVLIGVALGALFIQLTPSNWSELGDPRLHNFFYPLFLTHETFGFVLGGSLVGLVGVYSWKEGGPARYYMAMVLLPLAAVLLLDRSIPRIRYIGHLLPVWFILTVRQTNRFFREIPSFSRFVSAGIIIFVLIGVPVRHFSMSLQRVWQGHNGFVSFIQAKTPAYRDSVQWIRNKAKSGDQLLLLDYPHYVTRSITESFETTHHQSFQEETIAVERILRLENRSGRLWVLVSEEYRDPYSRGVKRYLRRKFEQVQFPRYFMSVALKLFVEPEDSDSGGD
jgi:hypothetical protein